MNRTMTKDEARSILFWIVMSSISIHATYILIIAQLIFHILFFDASKPLSVTFYVCCIAIWALEQYTITHIRSKVSIEDLRRTLENE